VYIDFFNSLERSFRKIGNWCSSFRGFDKLKRKRKSVLGVVGMMVVALKHIEMSKMAITRLQ
jgi:hypothetical protein